MGPPPAPPDSSKPTQPALPAGSGALWWLPRYPRYDAAGAGESRRTVGDPLSNWRLCRLWCQFAGCAGLVRTLRH